MVKRCKTPNTYEPTRDTLPKCVSSHDWQYSRCISESTDEILVFILELKLPLKNGFATVNGSWRL